MISRASAWDTLLVDPERLGAAAHLHARPRRLEVRIDADGQARRGAELSGDRERAAGFGLGFDVERHPGDGSPARARHRACRAGESWSARVLPGGEDHVELAARGDVEPSSTSHQFEDWPIGICFYCIM
jgi:hypothetical protein